MRATNKTIEKNKKKIDKITSGVEGEYRNDLYQYIDLVPQNIIDQRNKEKVWVARDPATGVIYTFPNPTKKQIKDGSVWQRTGSWDYGANEDYDFVNISKTGKIGQFVEVQGLKIALPSTPDDVFKRSEDTDEQYWERTAFPDDKIASKLRSVSMVSLLPPQQKYEWEDFIIEQWDRRDEGFWFMCNGVPTYITGSHYFYLQWAKIDVGFPDYRDANRIFFYFFEACRADYRAYGMCYLKNRRSGFSFMASSELVNQATQTHDAQYGILSMTRDDAQRMFTGKVVRIANNLPFFFTPIRSGESLPKSELLYQVPSTKLTRRRIEQLMLEDSSDDMVGLDSKIDFKATGNNSYDGQKLRLLAHDESGKWSKPNNILNNWNITKTCLRLGDEIVGKCMMGSTCNKQSEGGAEFKELYYSSDLRKVGRNKNGQTPGGMYSLFIPMEWNFEGKFDRFGYPIFNVKKGEIALNEKGRPVKMGVIKSWENEIDGLKVSPAQLNEHYRQYPRTESHAFRDEISGSIFNLAKIQDQIDHNDKLMIHKKEVMRGSFYWENGIPDSKVKFAEDPKGRFKVNWLPPPELRNNFYKKDGLFHPGNDQFGAFGCDSYDVSGTVYGSGSNGALSGVTGFSLHEKVPDNRFFLEYIARPSTVEIFFEEVLMACAFYGMPILVENNKPRLLYHLRDRGYRMFSLKRMDKPKHKLSPDELFLGGIPNSSQDVIQTHAASIESYIEEHIGINPDTGNMGYMAFQRTLEDWMWFDIKKRTVYDATIASGLALMGVRRHLFNNEFKVERKPIINPFGRYSNAGSHSKLKLT